MRLLYTPAEMLLDGWIGFAISLFSISLGIAGITWGLAISQGLRRRVLSLEFDVADLQDRLLREIKSRAGRAGSKAKQDDAEFEASVLAQPKKPEGAQPWWFAHIHPDLKNT